LFLYNITEYRIASFWYTSCCESRAAKEVTMVFINGKQVRIKRSLTVDSILVDQFIEENADPIWHHQNELWELLPFEDALLSPVLYTGVGSTEHKDEIPF
jgi:hypothetical protein